MALVHRSPLDGTPAPSLPSLADTDIRIIPQQPQEYVIVFTQNSPIYIGAE